MDDRASEASAGGVSAGGVWAWLRRHAELVVCVALIALGLAASLVVSELVGRAARGAGGAWRLTPPPASSAALLDVDYAAPDDVWVAGQGIVTHSTDGGMSWAGGLAANDVVFTSVCALGDKRVVAAGLRYSGDAQRGAPMIALTTDGGATWSALDDQSTPILYGVTLNDMDFAGDGHGLAVGSVAPAKPRASGARQEGILLETSDGGASWGRRPLAGAPMPTCVTHGPDGTWWIGLTGGAVLRSTDDGRRWRRLKVVDPFDLPKPSPAEIVAIVATGSDHVWALASQYGRYRDGPTLIYEGRPAGASWIWSLRLPAGHALCDLAVVDGKTLWAVGGQGTPFAKVNGPGTEQEDSFLLGSTDGGSEWDPVTAPTDHWLLAVDFADPQHGCIVGTKGTVLVGGK